MTTIPPNGLGLVQNPAALRLARAYGPTQAPAGLQPATRVDRVRDAAELSPAARAAGSTAPIARVGPAEAAPTRATTVDKLVAGTVPGTIDFRGETPEPGPARRDALPLYRHPADRNAAATGVYAGRLVDTEA